MTTKYNETTRETCITEIHPSGLTIHIVKKPGKSRKHAIIATKFGSVNRVFKTDGKIFTAPNGTAHFLEHKLFEGKNGGAFDFYAKTGAKANAYTSNDKTAYYFTCTDKFEDNLDILLSFISNPYLTDENVEKEKGIIGQEIRMYEDEPSWQGYFGLITNLYGTHPVKYDIAGSVEDIAPITVDTLMTCYNTFYQPSNMVLSVCGDIDEKQVLATVDKYFKPRTATPIEQEIPNEPRGVVREYSEKVMPVSRPVFNIGIKDNDCPATGYEYIKKDVECSMLAEILFGESTKFYKDLYDEGLINSEFECGFELSDTFAFLIVSGESEKPSEVLERVKARIKEFLAEGVSDERFKQVRNTVYGDLLISCDNVSAIATSLMNSRLFGFEPFERADVLSKVTVGDIMNRAKALLENPDISMSVIKGE